MIIGLPKEIKNHEYRVGLTPASVRELCKHGHRVLVQQNAALEIGFDDAAYVSAGASIVDDAAAVFAQAEMIVKVKEPQPSEFAMLRPGQILFTYLHLAPDLPQTQALLNSGAIAIAYETVTDSRGGLPLLAPMSEVAGRLAIQAGASAMEMAHGGRGLLLGGVPGVAPAKVCVIGGGVVGSNAARMAAGLGADVTILDTSLGRLKQLDEQFNGRVKTLYSTADALEDAVLSADLIIGAVLVPGANAPRLITAEMVKDMKRGSVLVDVAIDQGGCFETSVPTTHDKPTYRVDDVVHYCVANMPGAVARTSTLALNNATLPHVIALADKGWQQALKDDPHLLAGLNICKGKLTCEAVSQAHDLPFTAATSLLQ